MRTVGETAAETAEHFQRWHTVSLLLEQAIESGAGDELLARTWHAWCAALETLLRAISISARRTELNVQHAADANWQTIAGETQRIWERLDEHGRSIAALSERRCTDEDKEE